MNIDYLPNEMRANIDARPFEGDEFTVGFSVGWRAACEAWHKKSHPQPAPDWRAACHLGFIPGGCFSIQSPTRDYWITSDGKSWTNNGFNYVYTSEDAARAALAACPTPPPDAAEAARGA